MSILADLVVALRAADYVPLQRSRRLVKANGHAPPAGDLLAPGIEQVREALGYLRVAPHDPRAREYWVTVCHAIVGATAKSGEGRDLFMAWSSQWGDDPRAVEVADRLWQGIDPAHCHVGYRWLAHQAWEESAGRCSLIYDLDFDHDDEVDLKVNPPPVELEQPATMVTAADIGNMVDLLDKGAPSDAWSPIIAAISTAALDPGQVDDLLRRIKAATGTSLKVLRKQLTYEQLRRDLDRTYDVPRRLADAARGLYGTRNLAFHNGAWWRYGGKAWEQIDPNAIKKTMQHVALDQPALMMSVGDARPQNVNTAVTQAMGLLEQEVHDRLAPLLRPEMAMRPVINVANGTILISTADGSIRFKEHDPDDLLTYCCDLDYDPTATCPRFDAAFRDILSETFYVVRPGDPDYADTLSRLETKSDPAVRQGPARNLHVYDVLDNERMMLEVMGYALTPWREARCYFIAKGNGQNGKTRLFITVTKMLPPGTVQAGRIERLETNAYALSELAGKLLFLDDDLNYRAILPDGPLKMISENKLVTAQKKYLGDVSFHCATFPVMLCNSWPETTDLSAGTRERAIALEFRRIYKREEQHGSPWPSIWSDRKEMSGIFNRMLRALAGVIQRGYILPSRAGLDAHHAWISDNAPEVEFIHACCTDQKPAAITGNNGEEINDLYSAFRSYYMIHHGDTRYVHSVKRFRSVVEQMGYAIYRTGKYRHRVRGLWLRDDKVERGIGVSYIDPGGDDED
jgi:phage/plasmid-associated DNA primase